MASGKIVRLARDRGFGFIKPDGRDTEDVFFHRSALANITFESVHEGQPVTFTVEPSAKGPRAQLVHVTD